MNSKESRLEETLTIVQNIIANLTGNEIQDLDPEFELEDDLGITEVDFRRILSAINSDFDIHLRFSEISHEVETVEELARLVLEESELG